ncbi:MAG: DUF86 domain-containing protein [Deltaproteobacteria bacterium]|nr:DUF86 domain-containing protein [Deltaproteobacteria bacterium]
MDSAKTDAGHLWDMLDAAKTVARFVAVKSFRDYDHDRMLRNAVERNMEIIGGAASKVSPAFQNAHPEIPWRGLVIQRNALVEGDGQVKNDKMWVAASEFIPYLVRILEALIPDVARM